MVLERTPGEMIAGRSICRKHIGSHLLFFTPPAGLVHHFSEGVR